MKTQSIEIGQKRRIQLSLCPNCDVLTDTSGEFWPCCGEGTDELAPAAIIDGQLIVTDVDFATPVRNQPNERTADAQN